MTHDLKIKPEYISEISKGNKTFEIRKNDRDFKVGDLLHLKAFDGEKYLGYSQYVSVTYILHGPAYGLEEGFCIMSIR